jgi:2-polyprenyl-3-methyl-5-hydroxy-6-metoxy-1,4-benzoquinol methylase
MELLPVAPAGHEGGFDAALIDRLAAAEDHHFWFRARNQLVAATVRRLTRGWLPGRRVLEVGCGTGNVLRVLERECRGASLLGIDLYEEGLRVARRRVSCPLIQGDLRDLPPREKFHLIGAFDVIEHLPDDGDVLRSLRDRLEPGGRLVVTVPAYQALWSYVDHVACHCRRYSPHQLRARLEGAGYRVEDLTAFMAVLVPLVLMARKLRPAPASPSAGVRRSAQELRIIPGINALLRALLGLENFLLRSGFRHSCGTSLLAVATPA